MYTKKRGKEKERERETRFDKQDTKADSMRRDRDRFQQREKGRGEEKTTRTSANDKFDDWYGREEKKKICAKALFGRWEIVWVIGTRMGWKAVYDGS